VIQVTGRILVLPPNAVLYLLHLNKKWGDNKSSMEDYFDFDKLRASRGLQTLPMSAFLSTIAKNGLLKIPLPNNDTELVRAPLWDYLNSACYVRPWSPGKLFIGFNITTVVDGSATPGDTVQRELVGSFESTDPARLEEFSLKSKFCALLRCLCVANIPGAHLSSAVPFQHDAPYSHNIPAYRTSIITTTILRSQRSASCCHTTRPCMTSAPSTSPGRSPTAC